MNSLLELQEHCYRAFMLDDSTALQLAVRNNGVSAEHRIQIYQNNARETFRKALLASYPVIERLVGSECFAGLALKYMREHPSRSGDLQGFGTGFADFLTEVYENTRFSYLADVARLEWALEEVHLEPNEELLEPAELSTVSEADHPTLVFRLRKAVRLVRSPFPVLSIWRANQPGADTRIDLDKGAEQVAVLRSGDDLKMHPLDPDSFALATSFAHGASLQEAYESLSSDLDEKTDAESPNLAAALQSVMGLGLLSSFSVRDSFRPAP